MAQNDNSDATVEYHVEDYIEKWEERGQVYFTPKQRQFTVKSPVSNKRAAVTSPLTNKAAAANSPVTNKASIKSPLTNKAAAITSPLTNKAAPANYPVTYTAATSTSPVNNKLPPPVKALNFTPYTTDVQQNKKTQMSAMKSKMMTNLEKEKETFSESFRALSAKVEGLESENSELGNMLLKMKYENNAMSNKIVQLEDRYKELCENGRNVAVQDRKQGKKSLKLKGLNKELGERAVELEEVRVDNIDTKNDGKKKTGNKERSVWCSCCRRKN